MFSQGAYLSPNETFKQVVNSGMLLSEEKFIHVSEFVKKNKKKINNNIEIRQNMFYICNKRKKGVETLKIAPKV
ncbi:hypothetical protein GsuE55_27720 [Geobacillus subterraneus]|uniref:Uncharacterized protein n=1 Tax=Geobacillus subterraneus TaxID=129338 RepID=A0A679FS80_9BACL|nr:hypothetical protein GsuE55_27720 [Geobacillus subterraneus]